MRGEFACKGDWRNGGGDVAGGGVGALEKEPHVEGLI